MSHTLTSTRPTRGRPTPRGTVAVRTPGQRLSFLIRARTFLVCLVLVLVILLTLSLSPPATTKSP